MRLLSAFVVGALLLPAACVSQGKYDKALADSETANASLKDRDAKLTALEKDKSDLETKLADATTKLDAERKRADAAEAALGDTKGTLAELQKAREASEAREKLFQSLVSKLKSMVDAGELKVVVRDGRMVLQLPNDILFDSGKAKLKASGEKALKKLGAVLAGIKDRRFQVAGHTDNEPIVKASYTSNWELSSARAIAVVELLVINGVKPAALSAAGYGEFDPIAPNTTGAGKAKNRRTEITLQPNIEELVALPPNP
jgi:chemotaxis protein MotB